MSDKIVRPDGSVLTPINLADNLGITEKQLSSFKELVKQHSINGFNDAMIQQPEQGDILNGEFVEIIEAGKEDMIRCQADANAEAYVKALRSSPFLFDAIVGALAALCGNPTYNSSTTEDPMNDYVRDILGSWLQIRDQTRQGISASSHSAERGKAGELDIQIRNNGRPIGLYEGLRLDSVRSSDIYDHIKKATINYNPQGVKEVFVVAYVQGYKTGFGEFWKRMMVSVKAYDAFDLEHQIIWDEEEEDTGLSAIRSIHGIYNMNDVEHNVHIMAVKIME